MIKDNDFYRIVGLAFIIITVIVVGVNVVRGQGHVIEGLTNNSSIATDRDKIPDVVKSNNDKLTDSLLINKYRTSYEDTIIELDKAVSLGLVKMIINSAETISRDPNSSEAIKIMGHINEMKKFRESLNATITVLDNQ
jgi:hypothetical protein